MNTGLPYALRAFYRTKWLARRLRTRADVLRWRAARLEGFLRRDLPRVPFYAGLSGDLPSLDKAAMMQNFHRLNRPGIGVEDIRAALARGEERLRGYVVGQSTGTSGNRGLFIISEAERFTWLGTILAKTLPDFPFARHKVALILPGYGQIFQSAAQAGRLQIRFFDLKLGYAAWAAALEDFAPDTIMAPPKILRVLAESSRVRLKNVFSGAEVLDALDRRAIEARFGVVVRDIYMATEGLFGVACRHGTLHLAEDVMAFDWEAGGSGLVTPVITDFTRKTQIMARYRMNDLLRLGDEACACGSPLQAVAEIVGRQDDVFRIGHPPVLVTPDILRNAVLDSDARIDDFRIVQTGASCIELSLPPASGPLLEAAGASLRAALARAGAGAVEIRLKSGVELPLEQKLRRVRCALKSSRADEGDGQAVE